MSNAGNVVKGDQVPGTSGGTWLRSVAVLALVGICLALPGAAMAAEQSPAAPAGKSAYAGPAAVAIVGAAVFVVVKVTASVAPRVMSATSRAALNGSKGASRVRNTARKAKQFATDARRVSASEAAALFYRTPLTVQGCIFEMFKAVPTGASTERLAYACAKGYLNGRDGRPFDGAEYRAPRTATVG